MRAQTKSRLTKGGAALALCVTVVGGFEGLRLLAYRDIVNVPTICFGETRGVRMGDRETVDDCQRMLGDRLIEFSAEVDKCLIYQVPDKSYVAFVSLAYNIGSGAFCKSTVVRLANHGDVRGACDAILRFNRAGGRVVAGLVSRRRGERELCLEGIREEAG